MRQFDPGKAAEILELIAEQGLGLKAACERVGIPRRSVREWATVVPEFGKALQLARLEGYEHWSDEILEIADSVRASDSPAAVNAARLAVDSRKWLLSKLRPEQYGERVELTGAGGKDLIAAPEVQIPRLMQVLAVLLPGTGNSELHQLASTMAGKLKELEGPRNGRAED
jgi:Bacteriophage Sf6, terminase small subunit-like